MAVWQIQPAPMCKFQSEKVSYLASAWSGRVSQCGLTLWGAHSWNQLSKLAVCWVVLLAVATVHWHLDKIMSSFLSQAVLRQLCALEDPGCIGFLRCTSQTVSQACLFSYFALSFLVSTSGVLSPEIFCSSSVSCSDFRKRWEEIDPQDMETRSLLIEMATNPSVVESGVPIDIYSGGS